jgi:hypothetical protein
MRTLCNKTEAISNCLALTKPFDNWRDFHRYFYQGAEATPPWYVATNEQTTNLVRSRSYQHSVSRRLKFGGAPLLAKRSCRFTHRQLPEAYLSSAVGQQGIELQLRNFSSLLCTLK